MGSRHRESEPAGAAMSDIMPYGRWMKYTYGGVTSIRSSQLKAIDAALSGCHGSPTTENLDRLRTAIVGWMQKEGPRWKSSVRNRYRAVDDLHKQSMGIPVPPRAAPTSSAFPIYAQNRGGLSTISFAESRLIGSRGFCASWPTSFGSSFAMFWKRMRRISGCARRR